MMSLSKPSTKKKSEKKVSRPHRRGANANSEAQLQFSLTSQESKESFHLELFLALPGRIKDFTEHVVTHRPAYVFDMRTVPSFEGPHSSRRSVLRSMSGVGVRYADVMAIVENEGFLAAHIIDFCAHTAAVNPVGRSFVFLFESIRDLLWSSLILPHLFVQHTSKLCHVNFVGTNIDKRSFEHAIWHSPNKIPSVDHWMIGEVLHITAPVTAAVHSGINSSEVPVMQLTRGSSVRVLSTYSDFSARALVLSGPNRGEIVRISLMSKFARVVP